MGTQHKELRPENRRELGDGMKLHLRVLRLAGKEYRVITLRPGTDVQYSTNNFHDTWHIISDLQGARLLGRLMWGLAYQKQPNTLIAIHGEHLKPTPFEADASLPLLLVPAHLTTPEEDAFRELKKRLPHLGPPTNTIRWHTFGMAEYEQWEGERYERTATDYSSERTIYSGGFICYSSLPRIMRFQGFCVSQMRYCMGYLTDPSDYTYLSERRNQQTFSHPEGEVQIFAHYRTKLAVAEQAKREVLEQETDFASTTNQQFEIWDRADAIRKRRQVARKQREQRSHLPYG